MNRQRQFIGAFKAPRRTKRVGIAVAVFGVLALALSASVGVSSVLHDPKDTPGDSVVAQDAQSAFAKRSPGRRGLGELFQSKFPALAKIAREHGAGPRPAKPEAEVADVPVDGPLPAAIFEAPNPVAADVATPPLDFDMPVAATLWSPGPIGGGEIGLLSIPETPGGGGGGGGGGGSFPSILESPVPEPSTWAMMITGFFAIGLARRIRRNRVNAAQPASARGL